MKHLLFQQPATEGDLTFVMRCLWALDPNRHLFLGDFRDYARTVFDQRLVVRGFGVESSCVDEIAKLAKEFPCSDRTRQCWQQIAGQMKKHLELIHVYEIAQGDTKELKEFVERACHYGSGHYFTTSTDLPGELLSAGRLGFNATLEAVAWGLREHLSPESVNGAILLWTIWCLETQWPEGKTAGHFRTGFSLSWQLAKEMQGPPGDPDRGVISRLLSLGADLRVADSIIRSGGSSLAHGFASLATVTQLEFLLKAGLALDDPDPIDVRPLHNAIRDKNWRNAAWLLDHGADPNSRHLSINPIIVMCAERKAPYSLIERALALGADPNAQGHCRRTALHAAAFTGDLQVVRKLIANGVDLEALDTWGHTPLYRAVFAMLAGEGDRMPVIEALVSSGANPNPSGTQGPTLKDFLLLGRELGAPDDIVSTLLHTLSLQ